MMSTEDGIAFLRLIGKRSFSGQRRASRAWSPALRLWLSHSLAKLLISPSNCPHEMQPAESAVNDKPKRRWYQFSLLTMLVVLTLTSVPLGYIAWEREECRRGTSICAQITKLGGL